MTKALQREYVWLLLALLLFSGCARRGLLHDIAIRPATISPNADGSDDVAEVKYSLSRQSRIDIYLRDAEGQRYDFRVEKRRSKGDRTAYFGGVIDGRLLPDGHYQMIFEATDERGYSERVERSLEIQGGDPLHLSIDNLNIWPETFTPNRDGITDRVTIGYSLNKEATRVEVYILGADGTKYPVPEDKIREMGTPGSHEHDYDAGIDLGATPPPDGVYTVVVEAVDAVGNQARVQGQLAIQGGGVPRVEVVNRAAVFSHTVVPLGATLSFTCTVKNIGTVPVRTKGPESGTLYGSTENFNTLGEYEEPGLFRVGLDFEGNSFGRIYPYRWQLGTDAELTEIDTAIGPMQYLMPGQTVMVVGHLRMDERFYKTEPYFWLGLIHEQVEIVQDRIEPTPVTIAF
ncbi:MAG: hypothetical protein JXA74_09625 [Anaerolineae bacterium]|nr:hypothetical protein [Anaerolineae bacterium]